MGGQGVHTSHTPFLASPALTLAFLSLAIFDCEIYRIFFFGVIPPPPLFLPLPTLLDLWDPDLCFPPPVRPRPYSLELPPLPPPHPSYPVNLLRFTHLMLRTCACARFQQLCLKSLYFLHIGFSRVCLSIYVSNY